MAKYNYIKAPVEAAKRAGLNGMRRSAGKGYVILSESDLRMVDLTIEEKIEFFGCQEVTEDQARVLINENSNVDESDTTESEMGVDMDMDADMNNQTGDDNSSSVGWEDTEPGDNPDSDETIEVESMEGEDNE